LQNGNLIGLKLAPRRRRSNQATPRYVRVGVFAVESISVASLATVSARNRLPGNPVTARLSVARGSFVFCLVDFYDL